MMIEGIRSTTTTHSVAPIAGEIKGTKQVQSLLKNNPIPTDYSSPKVVSRFQLQKLPSGTPISISTSGLTISNRPSLVNSVRSALRSL